MNRLKLLVVSAVTAFVSLGTQQVWATVPCEAEEPCHNNFAEVPLMIGLGTEAYGIGFVSLIGNAVSLGKDRPTHPAWLAMGYIGSIYNLALGTTWTSLGGESLSAFADDGYARMQLGIGIAHLVLGTATFAVTVAGNTRELADEAAPTFTAVPVFTPAPGGGTVSVAGQF